MHQDIINKLKSKQSVFITFEGIDGSGKSTQILLLKQRLIQLGHKVHTTFEPTNMPIGLLIRDILNNKIEGDQSVIATLFAADRLHHITHSENGILHKLSENHIVLCDRYYLSSYAYHSANGQDLDWVMSLNKKSAAMCRPDLHIYIDVKPEISMSRVNTRQQQKEIYETEIIQSKVYNQYTLLLDLLKDKENIEIIDGSKSINSIQEDICHLLGI